MNDMIVISPPVSVPDGSYNFVGISMGNRLSAGATATQIAAPYYGNGGLTQDCMIWLAKYVETHDLSDPNVQRVISGNIGLFCDADKKLVNNPKMMVLSAFGSNSVYNYKKQNIKQMSGNVTTPFMALANYLWGNGEERSVPLDKIGLKLQPSKLPPVMNVVNSGVTGLYNIDGKFPYATGQDSLMTSSYLGNITLHTTGILTINSNGSWSYDGTVRAYNDIYDANPSNHRGVIGEAATTILRYLDGTPYQISMPGEIKVTGAGER